MGGYSSAWFTMQRPHSGAEFAKRGLTGRRLSPDEIAAEGGEAGLAAVASGAGQTHPPANRRRDGGWAGKQPPGWDCPGLQRGGSGGSFSFSRHFSNRAVSYTHLTLPTILRV